MTQFYAGTTSYSPSSYKGDSKPAAQQGQADSQQQQTSATPKTTHSINISQILVDFKNTIASIGATPEIEQKVNTYISMVESEAAQETPRRETIITNLKTASKLLDDYISQTLRKPSSVVQDWMDAFLLQEVDYKADQAKAAVSASAQLESEMDPKVKERIEAQALSQGASAVSNYNNYQNQSYAKKNTQSLPQPAQSVQQQAEVQPPQSQETPAPRPKKQMKFATTDGKIVQGDQVIGEQNADGSAKIYTPEEAAQKAIEEKEVPTEITQPPLQVTPQQNQVLQPESSDDIISKNSLVQGFYEKAKQYLEQGDSQKALESYKKTLNYAKKANDKDAQAYIIQGIGESYDDLNNLARAAKCFNKVTKSTKDTGLKATGHNSLGEVYDEAGKFDLAMDHYFESLSLNGQTDDTSAQAQTLNNIGKMKTSQYMSKDAIDFYKLALDMAKQNTPDVATMGNVLSNTADAFKALNKPQSALKYYQKSLVCAEKADDKQTASEAYEKAGDLMKDMNKNLKAQSLYKKAMQEALNSKNTDQVRVLREKMAAIAS